MSFDSTLVATFDAPLGFTTVGIQTDFDGMITGLGSAGQAASVFVQAYQPIEASLTQINSQAQINAAGGGTSSCVGHVAYLSPTTTIDASAGGITKIVGTVPMVYNGTTFDRQRTPNVFKTARATASGNTNIWTPASGKKFRLMRLLISLPQNCAAASPGNLFVTLQDSATAINIGLDAFIPSVAVTTFGPGVQSGWLDLGNGILSAAANNILHVNLSFALTSGGVDVMAVGTEE